MKSVVWRQYGMNEVWHAAENVGAGSWYLPVCAKFNGAHTPSGAYLTLPPGATVCPDCRGFVTRMIVEAR